MSAQSSIKGAHCGKTAGFTLIEVLAALLIFSFAIISLTTAGAQTTRATGALEAKMLAAIVADNQLVLARTRVPEAGAVSGQSAQFSRDFSYVIDTRQTQIPRLFQITVNVSAAGSPQILESRIGFQSVAAPSGFDTDASSFSSTGQ